ncbi:MAG: DNA translocase FtsK, partial [Muribaculaceae bacterium]|nr:DNA translocase FtsK [Muribaculaceae bacterium]
YIVIVIDELADLMLSEGREIEPLICRITQKGRAVGMHMIIATQRPSKHVISNRIKANFPARIAFKVNQRLDSLFILDHPGAEQLIGRGDALFYHQGLLERLQIPYINVDEIEFMIKNISAQRLINENESVKDIQTELKDPLFNEAALLLYANGENVTISTLQRTFAIGFQRAKLLMKQLESAGIIDAVKYELSVDYSQLISILYKNN